MRVNIAAGRPRIDVPAPLLLTKRGITYNPPSLLPRHRMIDAITRERIVIHNEGTGAPYLMVAEEQVETVVEALRNHGVTHWVDEDTISLDGEPPVAVVNLSRATDVSAAQRVLDSL